MDAAHLHQNQTLLCGVRRIVGTHGDEFVFQAAQLLPFKEGDALHIITTVAPTVGFNHYITFDHLADTLHIEIKSVSGQSPDFVSRCTCLKRT